MTPCSNSWWRTNVRPRCCFPPCWSRKCVTWKCGVTSTLIWARPASRCSALISRHALRIYPERNSWCWLNCKRRGWWRKRSASGSIWARNIWTWKMFRLKERDGDTGYPSFPSTSWGISWVTWMSRWCTCADVIWIMKVKKSCKACQTRSSRAWRMTALSCRYPICEGGHATIWSVC